MTTADERFEPRTLSDQLVIVLEDDVDDSVTRAEEATPSHIHVVDTNESLNMVLAAVQPPPEHAENEIEREMEALRSEPGLKTVEPNVAVGPPHPSGPAVSQAVPEDDLEAPNDPLYPHQSGPQMVDAPAAWEITQGESDITIAICDSGIKYDHEDLAANMDESVDNYGYDFINHDPDPYPRTFSNEDNKQIESHGTQTAGIVGAITDNDVGVAGISDCSLLSVKIGDWMTGEGWADGWAMVNGVEWAVSAGADVILVNVDGSGIDPWPPFDEVVRYADAGDTITIAAAGNGRREYDAVAYASQCHMAVAAASSKDELAEFSSYGDFVTVTAPGTRGYTTYPAADGEPADEYSSYGGTSMAAPVVAGVAGLILSVDDTFSIEEVKTIIEETATDMGLPEVEQGHGLVNAAAAVREAMGPAVGSVAGVNRSGGELSEVYWDTGASETAVGIHTDEGESAVTGLSTSQMHGQVAEETMSTFDFTETWDTNTRSHPTFAWQDEPVEHAPAVTDYMNDDEIVDATGLRDAFADWQADEIDAGLLREVFDTWQTGTTHNE